MDTNENKGMNRRDFVKLAAGAAVVAGVATAFPTAAMAADPFPMPALPYADNALEPVISAKTISFHYGKHTAAYYKTINSLDAEKKLSGTLEGIIAATHGKDDMAAVYNALDLVCLSSAYGEGFPNVLGEAMACGVPVICSNAGSLPEVAGDAGIQVNPDDVNGFTAAIHDVLTHPATLQALSEKGLARAATFRWERTARETLSIYEELANA